MEIDIDTYFEILTSTLHNVVGSHFPGRLNDKS